MACEEYVFKHIDEEVFMLWQNSPAIIVGKNQNTIEEINSNYVEEKNIAVVRRLSGGGAVYHDHGNINFTFVVKYDSNFFEDFDIFTKPVIDTLADIGITAQLHGRNDISIDGRKFSGNSQVVWKDRILHHGTIMVDVNTEVLSNALKVKASKIESKGVKSVRKRVTNINSHLSNPIEPSSFLELLANHVKDTNKLRTYHLSSNDLNAIDKLSHEKYRRYDWVYGESPNYNFKKEVQIPAGRIEFVLNIKNGIIEDANIYGDFFGIRDANEVAKMLVGIRHTKKDIYEILNNIEIEKYFYSVTRENLSDLLDQLFS